jgi:uncharacterized membrane protein YphA (DoxX/SURF4 family)
MREANTVWSLPRRLGFLILAVFLFLSAAPTLISIVPVLGDGLFIPAYQALWNGVVVWLGEHVFALPEPITILPNGSGDTTWNYVQMFGIVMLSLIVGSAWALADRKREHYAQVHHWLKVLVRYSLASTMFMYGLFKLYGNQFPFPSLTTLTQTYGEASPMGLAWTFMGYSPAYNMFAGAAEVLAGVLLLSRRTTTLGALTTIGVMSNVAAMNYCYDIPVKLFSTTLLVMAAYLFADDFRRFADLLIHNRPTEPVPLRPHFVSKAGRRVRIALKSFYGLLLALIAVTVWLMSSEYGPGAPKPPLYGLYEVERFTADGTELPPLLGDELRWRHFIVEAWGFAAIRTMDSKRELYGIETDTTAHTITLVNRKDPEAPPRQFTYEETGPESLVLRGKQGEVSVEVTLRKVDPNSFLLVNRWFHWVNEYPLNR